MSRFKYDVILLIDLVKNRPCLWDKTLETYRDRLERRSAWEEIFATLDERYNEELSSEEKRFIGEMVLSKWTNLRDTFNKSLKSKMGRPKKKYVYHDCLKFLLKGNEEVAEVADYNSILPQVNDDASDEYSRTEEEPKPKRRMKRKRANAKSEDEDFTADVPAKKAGNSSKTLDSDSNSNDINFVECDEMERRMDDPRIMNEDEAFFASLLPAVVKYNEEERLEFRMEVLSVMQKINQKKSWADE